MNFEVLTKNTYKFIIYTIFFFCLLTYVGELGYKNYKYKYKVKISEPMINGIYVNRKSLEDLKLLDKNNPRINVTSVLFNEQFYDENIPLSTDEKYKFRLGLYYPKNFDFLISNFHYQKISDFFTRNYVMDSKVYDINTSKDITIDEIRSFFEPVVLNQKTDFKHAIKIYKKCFYKFMLNDNYNIQDRYLKSEINHDPRKCIIYPKGAWIDHVPLPHLYKTKDKFYGDYICNEEICSEIELSICRETDLNRTFYSYNKFRDCSIKPQIKSITLIHGNIKYHYRLIYYFVCSCFISFLTQFFIFKW